MEAEKLFFAVKFFSYFFLSFLVALFLEPIIFYFLEKFNLRQNIRKNAVDGKIAKIFHQLHSKKAGTPVGGGIMIWGTVVLVIFYSRFLSFCGVLEKSLLQRAEIYLPLFTLVIMGIFGAIDDFWNSRKIGKKTGISAGPKMFFITLFALMGSFWFYFKLNYTEITIPGIGVFDIGIWAIPVFVFVIIGTANAVNITDGLDGLAGGVLIFNFAAFGALAFFRGHEFLTIFCGIICAALLAFLWFNVTPAKFFMGDTGSLALGATLGVIAMMIDAIVVLPIIGFIFVFEAFSVILQLFSKKFFKKKIFLIAPIHHHFEKIGWGEAKIVMRFWILGVATAAIGLIFGMIGLQT